jgi:hypothetical protein
MTDNIPENEQARPELSEVAKELEEVGKRLAEAMKMAWHSKERVELEKDIRQGLNRLVEEVDAGFAKVRETEPAQKVQAKVSEVADEAKTSVASSKAAEEVRKGLIVALRGLSDALEKMANTFTTPEGEEAKK